MINNNNSSNQDEIRPNGHIHSAFKQFLEITHDSYFDDLSQNSDKIKNTSNF
jgi:predicted HD phosphohydrolase